MLGAVLTVLAAAVFDLMADEAPLHAVTIAAVGAAAAVLRSRLVGRSGRLVPFVSACVVAQPVLHLGAKWAPRADVVHSGHGLGLADLAVIGTQVGLALVLVALVTFAEQLVALAVGVIRVCWLVVIRTVPDLVPPTVRVRPPSCRPMISRFRSGPTARRGPPRPVLATA